MSIRKTKSHLAYERAERHLASIRWVNMLLLFAMAGFDAAVNGRFDFPFPCYILIVGVILGLDITKVAKLFKR